MAVLKSIATGNFTAAATWGLIDSGSYLHESFANHQSQTLTTSYVQSQAFTPGAITISHIGVKLATRTATVGTISIRLVLSSDNSEVAGTLATINTADLPPASAFGSSPHVSGGGNGGFIFFKLASPVTLLAATAYKLEAKTSNGSQVNLYRALANGGNWFRALVTTTTQAPGAGDVMFVGGEYTGAGTSNSFTVTMDNTNASTDFGDESDSSRPSLWIGAKGTLTWGTNPATNYHLKISGHVSVGSEGIYEMGTSGTPCPRDSTMTLEFDTTSWGTWGFIARHSSTVTIAGQSRTAGKNVVWSLLNANASANATSLSIDTDTGWLDNDEIGVAPTGRNFTQGETGKLNGNAGASTLNVKDFLGTGGGLQFAHLGSSPEQAEVVLLTRNVTIRGQGITSTAYFKIWVNTGQTQNHLITWCAFKFLGLGADRNMCEVEFASGTDTAVVEISYCSSYLGAISAVNGTGTGFNFISTSGGATPVNLSVQSCVCYGVYVGFSFPTQLFNVVADDLVAINLYSTGNCNTLNSGSSSFTNIRVAGGRASASSAVVFNASAPSGHSNYPDGVVDTVLVHSSNNESILMTDSYRRTFSNLTVYRGSIGIIFQNTYGGTVQNLTVIGCSSVGITFVSNYGEIILDNVVVAGETGFSTPTGLNITGTANSKFKIINSNFGVVSGSHTDFTTQHILVTNSDLSYYYFDYLFVNCNFNVSASSLIVNTLRYQHPTSKLRFQRYNGVAGNHFTLTPVGNITRETTTVRTGASSVKLTPTWATSVRKLILGTFRRPVANGASLTASVYVYEDAAYNGSRARLILKRNEAIGINSDIVLAAATAASDEAWEQLTDTTPVATDNGVMEFIIDCDGSLGNLFVDDFTT